MTVLCEKYTLGTQKITVPKSYWNSEVLHRVAKLWAASLTRRSCRATPPPMKKSLGWQTWSENGRLENEEQAKREWSRRFRHGQKASSSESLSPRDTGTARDDVSSVWES